MLSHVSQQKTDQHKIQKLINRRKITVTHGLTYLNGGNSNMINNTNV